MGVAHFACRLPELRYTEQHQLNISGTRTKTFENQNALLGKTSKSGALAHLHFKKRQCCFALQELNGLLMMD